MKSIIYGFITFNLFTLYVEETQACWGSNCDRYWCDNKQITRYFPANKDDHDKHLRNEHPIRNAGKVTIETGNAVYENPIGKLIVNTVLKKVIGSAYDKFTKTD